MEYGEVIGLWLNIPRARLQDAFCGGIGQQIGAFLGSLGDEYGDAMALTEQEAMEQAFRINADRKMNRILGG